MINLLLNVSQNYNNLRADFIGISFNIFGVGSVLFCITYALLSLAAYHLFGELLLKYFFKNLNISYRSFVSIAIGYILFGSVIAILGVFSLLYSVVLSILSTVLLVAGLISVYKNKRNIKLAATKMKHYSRNSRLISIILIVFVLLISLKLLLPETAEDAVGYHTDLPVLYLKNHSTMLFMNHPQHVIEYPQLGEMHYVLPIYLGIKDATRYIHFSFFILFLLFLIQITRESLKKYKYAPLIFITTPLVIKYASTAYVDFFMLFLFFLSTILLIISSKPSRKVIILCGLLFGGAMSIKLWLLAFLPLLAFLTLKKNKGLKNQLIDVVTLTLSSLAPSIIWYLRAYILQGNPIYPLLGTPHDVDTVIYGVPRIRDYVILNLKMYSSDNMRLLSPLFFVAALMTLIKLPAYVKVLKGNKIAVFFVLLTFWYTAVNLTVIRYAFVWYSYAMLNASLSLPEILRWRICRIAITFGIFVLFSYYLISTTFLLPYAFGWADQNKYLTRILSKDNSSYYDFDRSFGKYIQKGDVVMTYGIFGFYYADFDYIDINNIYKSDARSYFAISNSKITKLLLKGGDFLWFCKKLNIRDCDSRNVVLLATYPKDTQKYNLYKIIK